MAEHTDNNKNKQAGHDRIMPQSIVEQMRKSYLDYAMSVITSRALPDVRDGLKPVHRRIIYVMQEMNLTASSRFRKSAAVVGDVMGKYHPHGDSAIYDSMVGMAQDFNYRYPLVWGQGNFGSIDGDSPAAMRYTEAKMTRITAELLADINKNTVNYADNYDGSRQEPTVLPTRVPNILLNGGLGIAVGMATNIPPHNLTEVCNALIEVIDNPDATTEILLEYITGPDYPTGGMIFDAQAIREAYETGRGGVTTRGHAIIEEGKGGTNQIIVSSLPYRVNKATFVEKIATLFRDKKLEGLKDLRDESTKDIRVVIELKRGAQPQRILNALYKNTQLEDNFNFNMVCLVDGVPQTMNLKGILGEFIKHRQEVVTRATQFDLDKAEARAHIVEGLKVALDHIDEVIKLIRASRDTKTAHAGLMKKFSFSHIQATAILEMRLQKLSGLERSKVEDELKELKKTIKDLKAILKDPQKVLDIIKEQTIAIRDKYGDERRTQVIPQALGSLSAEDLIPEEESTLILTSGGYIKRTNPDEFKAQKRGGKGVVDMNTKEEDVIAEFITASTHADVLFFSSLGKVYVTKMYDLPEGRRATRGKYIANFLPLAEDETITSVLALAKGFKKAEGALMMVTQDGTIKKTDINAFANVRSNGIIAINLKDNNKLVDARVVKAGDTVLLASHKGQAIRFKEDDIRAMGRTASGVRGMKLSQGDYVVSMSVIPKEWANTSLLILGEHGYGKKTDVQDYKIQGRGGSGVKAMKVTSKTGPVVGALLISAEHQEVIAMSSKSQVIRLSLDDIPLLGRDTQGVRVMRLKTGDTIASFVRV
ncbi:MAG: DNA gyrase subunit A [Patescibacteria group bacterium]